MATTLQKACPTARIRSLLHSSSTNHRKFSSTHLLTRTLLQTSTSAISSQSFSVNQIGIHPCNLHRHQLRYCSSESVQSKLMAFFDDQKNWRKKSISVGKSWEKADLRTRSNQQLHQLWYVLLKEMNMLLTMKSEFDRLNEALPNPERLEKFMEAESKPKHQCAAKCETPLSVCSMVETSLDNLRDVVDERNLALSMLETGEPPHPKWIDDIDELDRPIRRLEEEHLIPKEYNEQFLKKNDHLGDWTIEFKRRWNAQKLKRDATAHFKAKKLYKRLLEKYPHLSEDPNFLNEYCREKVTPIDPNPDVEQLIEQSNKE